MSLIPSPRSVAGARRHGPGCRSTPRRSAIGAAAGALVLIAAGCGDSEAPDASGPTTSVSQTTTRASETTSASETEEPTASATASNAAVSEPVTTTNPTTTEPPETTEPSETTSATTEPTDTGTTPDQEPTSTDTGTAAPEGTTAVLQYAEVQVPAGWEVQDMGNFAYEGGVQPPDPIPPHQWCLVPPDAGASLFGCAGVSIALGGDWLPGHNGHKFADDQRHGWYAAAPPALCPFDPEADGGEPNHLSTDGDGTPVGRETGQVAGMEAHHLTWEASCQRGGHTFTPQAWHVPEARVLVKDYLGHEDTGAILGSMEFTRP